VELEVGPVAHGGHCVARHDGRVVFVRHALPGERVVARLTEAGQHDRFWRADAVEVLRPSPDRVEPPCPLARPGGCGGCDWQHVSPAAQRRLKAAVVVEQLTRLGRVDPAAVPGLADLAERGVEAVPGDVDGLGWRTRVRYAVDPHDGRAGLFRQRSHDVVRVPHCPIAHPALDEIGVGAKPWRGTAAVDAVVTSTGERLLVVEPSTPGGRVSTPPLGAEAAVAVRGTDGLQRLRGRTWVSEQVELDGVQRTFRVTGGGFWQVHPGAAQTLLDAVLRLAGAVEAASEHPVGAAVAEAARAACGELPPVTSFRSEQGLGVRGVAEGLDVRVGRASWVGDLDPELDDALAAAEEAGRTAVVVAWDGRARGVVAVADTIRPTSAAAIADLRALGLRPVLLTGDNERAARAVAAQLGITG